MKKFEAKIDLHGYTLQDAYNIFAEFIEYAHESGFKNLLVVTGKGNYTGEFSKQTINYEFAGWCQNPALRRYIKSFSTAEIRHGGAGAFYVRLY
jgi:DNA-nicking Smr family endonuclease